MLSSYRISRMFFWAQSNLTDLVPHPLFCHPCWFRHQEIGWWLSCRRTLWSTASRPKRSCVITKTASPSSTLSCSRCSPVRLRSLPDRLSKKYTVRIYPFCLECYDLNIKGLLTGRYTGVSEKSHGWNFLVNRLVDTVVDYMSLKMTAAMGRRREDLSLRSEVYNLDFNSA